MERNRYVTLICGAAVAITSSIFADEPSAEGPRQLQSLVESYEREKARVLGPLDRKFDAALLEMQRQFTKAGRLEDALTVNKMIESRGGKSASKPSWRDTRWKWGSGGVLELKRNGDATHTDWSKFGEWEVLDDGTLKLVSQHGESTIAFSDEKSGIVTSARGGQTTLTRIE